MITMKELLNGHLISDVPHAHQLNLEELLKRVNIIRQAYSKPMIVTSGYRSLQEHLRIYSQIAARKGEDFNPKKVPIGSQHLIGAAVDFADPTGELYKWAMEQQEILEKAGIWCEKNTVGWLHCQIFPPKSGNRFFLP